MSGWIKLHRKIKDHWIFDNPDYFRAWAIMIMRANHKKKGFIINNMPITCDRGQCALSKSNWATEFGTGWTRQKVRTFFKKLEADGMIVTSEITNTTTKLTICNYGDYQSSEPSGEPTYNQPLTNPQPTLNQPVTTNKDLKNNKNEEKKKNEDNKKNKENKIDSSNNSNKESINEIVDYLNSKTGKKYRSSTGDTVSKIKARLNDKYTVEDFKKVIDTKVNNWTGTEYEKFLQPSTLFGNNFDNYLNESLIVKTDKEQDGIANMLGFGDSTNMPFKVIVP